MSIRPTNFEPLQEKGQISINKLSLADFLDSEKSQVEFKENLIQKSERPDLGDARVIFAGGRAFKNKENFDILYKLADKVPDSNVGASRAAVDANFCSNDLQIGQTGRIVAP